MPLLEADGQTHRRECECARCDTGYRPAERARQQAVSREATKRTEEQGRKAAVRAVARRRALAQLEQEELEAHFARQRAATDARLAALREIGDRVRQDERLDTLLALRRQGWTLAEALQEAERRAGSGGAGDSR